MRKRAAPGTVDVLRRVPYFASLPIIELSRLAARCSTRSLDARDVLFEEGQPCRGLFIIVHGLIEIRQVSLRGREQVFHTEGPGATLGEAPLFDGGGYIASAVALMPTRVLFLARAELLGLCRRRPVVALAILRAMARRVRHFANLVSDLTFLPVTERLARHLVAPLAEPVKPGLSLDIALTHAQLAARLGTVRELVTRAFSELERTGVISRNGSRIVIRDPARLATLARGEERTAPGGHRVT
jgi:CRP-like cAMP-binding protein